jgi:hypothetical protein
MVAKIISGKGFYNLGQQECRFIHASPTRFSGNREEAHFSRTSDIFKKLNPLQILGKKINSLPDCC